MQCAALLTQAHHMSNTEDRLLRLPAVMEVVNLRRSAIYKMMSAGKFPRSVNLTGSAVAWWESEIKAWMRDLPRTQRVSERAHGSKDEQEKAVCSMC